MEKRFSSPAALIVVAVITVLALNSPVRYNWPDNVHVRYGFPLTWGTHTLITIQGPVDIWRVNITALILDLTLWLALMVASSIILQMRGRAA